jgi:hypothetical protein
LLKSKTATIQYEDTGSIIDKNRSQSKTLLGKVMDFTVMKFGNLFRADSPSQGAISLRLNEKALKSARGTVEKKLANPLKPPLYDGKQA